MFTVFTTRGDAPQPQQASPGPRDNLPVTASNSKYSTLLNSGSFGDVSWKSASPRTTNDVNSLPLSRGKDCCNACVFRCVPTSQVCVLSTSSIFFSFIRREPTARNVSRYRSKIVFANQNNYSNPPSLETAPSLDTVDFLSHYTIVHHNFQRRKVAYSITL